MSDIEFPDTLLDLERAAWEEHQAGRLTVATANAVQDAITAHAKATGLDRYTVEMALKKAVRHAEAEG
ncbi:hypothetical protein [Streptomyces swartbergensis]|uniref:Uncharacterized protein n=1 Tax=Streptomyces swartbergensis TaxID=487165 RepID=A0A243SAM7_9ACTN|nr:hypothetical protein [Streptomyces swartbergensis]OUD04727.1 hypothetical protein CA983_02950 [Streptomyces swartbergensis]